MASNFQFLAEEKQFEGLYHVAVVAESSYNFQPQDPDTTIMLTRKALEYAVKWIYTYDSALNTESEKINIEKDPLSKLITIKTFRDIVGKDIYQRINFLRILGNRSAHSFNNKTTLKEAEVALENLFIVCDFIYYCYSKESKYLNNTFDIKIIKNTLPPQKESIDEERVCKCLQQAQIWKEVIQMPLGINTLIGENGLAISGGQRQRIALARALYKNFEILIMDEATAALDMETEKAVLDSIQEIKGNKTLLMVTHHMSLANECELLYKIENRKIIRIR